LNEDQETFAKDAEGKPIYEPSAKVKTILKNMAENKISGARNSLTHRHYLLVHL